MNLALKQGIECIKQGENRKAVHFLKKSLQIEPNNPEIYRHLGLAYSNVGNHKKAINQWIKAIELDPTHYQTIWNLGNLYEIERKFDKAYDTYSKAAEIASLKNPKKAIRYREWANRVREQ
ncbi:MAG: tetratricopeptide repeat protein [Candidatus Hodarchaeales archaeon]|jgi:Flp pilus assembly protein TadD